MTQEEKMQAVMNLEKPFYSIDEAAAILGVHERTIRYHIKVLKDLPAGKVGRLWRIAKQDLLDFIKKP